MANKVRILHLISSADPRGGGPVEGILQQNVVGESHHSTRTLATIDPPDAPWISGLPITVVALGDLDSSSREKLVRRLPWLRYGWSWRYVRWLKANLHQFDVVVLNGLWNFTSMGFILAKGRRRVPYVVFTHGMLDPWFRRTYPLKHLAKQLFWWLADGRAMNGADAVLFTSEEERQQAEKAFWPYRPRELVVPYGSGRPVASSPQTEAAFAAVTPRLNGRPYLLFLSRIHRKKGVDLLIEAFAKIASRRPELDLVIAGPDQESLRSALETRAATLGIAQRLHWPGMLQGEAKWGAYHGCEAFVLPSHQENFGIVVAEALSCGKPVLISDKVNIWREIAAAGAGFVAPDTVEGTSANLEALLALDGRTRDEMGKRARQCFDEHFDVTRAALTTLDILAAVAEGRLNLPRYGEGPASAQGQDSRQ